MILIADCSALVALAVCDSLNLLEKLFDCAITAENRAIGYLFKPGFACHRFGIGRRNRQ